MMRQLRTPGHGSTSFCLPPTGRGPLGLGPARDDRRRRRRAQPDARLPGGPGARHDGLNAVNGSWRRGAAAEQRRALERALEIGRWLRSTPARRLQARELHLQRRLLEADRLRRGGAAGPGVRRGEPGDQGHLHAPQSDLGVQHGHAGAGPGGEDRRLRREPPGAALRSLRVLQVALGDPGPLLQRTGLPGRPDGVAPGYGAVGKWKLNDRVLTGLHQAFSHAFPRVTMRCTW